MSAKKPSQIVLETAIHQHLSLSHPRAAAAFNPKMDTVAAKKFYGGKTLAEYFGVPAEESDSSDDEPVKKPVIAAETSSKVAPKAAPKMAAIKKQSGESNLVLQSCNGKTTAKKREREDTDSRDAGLVLEHWEDSQKRYLQEKSDNIAKIYSLTSEVSSLKQQQLKLKDHQLNAKVGQLLCMNDNRPLKALWEALNDKATPGIEVPMAIVMDPRCGIERRAESDGIDLPNIMSSGHFCNCSAYDKLRITVATAKKAKNMMSRYAH